MKTFAAKEDGSRLIAFEIENIYVSRKAVAKILAPISGVTDVRCVGRFGSADDIRVSFSYLGVDCVVLEPFGDNSRYWIGPMEPSNSSCEMRTIECAFNDYTPPFHRKIIGDILNLKFLSKSSAGKT